MAVLTRFTSTRPRYVVSQEQSLDWLARAHAGAQALRAGLETADRERFARKIARLLDRVGGASGAIATRASVLPDFASGDGGATVLYDTAQVGSGSYPRGKGASARLEVFTRAVDDYFAAEYAGEEDAPDDLIHVTCTGYVSPSGAQKLVARIKSLQRATAPIAVSRPPRT